MFAGLMLCKVRAPSFGGGGAGRWYSAESRTEMYSQSAEVLAVTEEAKDDDADDIMPSDPRAVFKGGCELDLGKPGAGNRIPWLAR
jgi:hypothetical protein